MKKLIFFFSLVFSLFLAKDLFSEAGVEKGLRVVRGSIDKDGNCIKSACTGFTSSAAGHGIRGVYTIKFTPGFSSPPAVVVTPNYPVPSTKQSEELKYFGDYWISVNHSSTNTVKIGFHPNDNNPASRMVPFNFIAIGPA